MAQRRMFNKTVTNNDNFLEMPASSQNLYFHLSMNADDDGFIDNWKSIMRMLGAKEDDLRVLISKQYIIPFETGVIVIRHWRLNNYLQNDRINPTTYTAEKEKLTIDNGNVYNLYTKCIHSIDKNSIDKNSIDNNICANDVNKKTFEKEFDELWNLYPIKRGRSVAIQKYLLARKQGATYEEVRQGLESYIKYCADNRITAQYIKHGSTWFNQKCWKDNYENIPKQNENKSNSKKIEIVPEWFGKETKADVISEKEENEMKELLNV